LNSEPKILHITPSYKPAWVYGGPTVSVSLLAEWQSKSGADVAVLSTTANGKSDFEANPAGEVIDGVKVFRFRRLTKDHTHFSPGLLFFVLFKSATYSVIHLHSWWNLVTILSALILRIQGRKFILSPRGMFSSYTLQSPLRKWIHLKLTPFLLKNARFHATSESEATEIRVILPDSDIVILPNYIPLPEKENIRKSKKEKTFRFLFYSRIHDKKGLEFTFECLSSLENTNWIFTIAGDGEPAFVNHLKTIANSLNIGEKINWTGFVEKEKKASLFSNNDLFILLSKNENFGNAVIESLAYGVPVFISDQVGSGEWVKRNSWGWVLPLEKNSIISQLDRIMKDQGQMNEISMRCEKEVTDFFKSNRLAGNYLGFYRDQFNNA